MEITYFITILRSLPTRATLSLSLDDLKHRRTVDFRRRLKDELVGEAEISRHFFRPSFLIRDLRDFRDAGGDASAAIPSPRPHLLVLLSSVR